MIKCRGKSWVYAHLQSWDVLRLFDGTSLVLSGVADREVGVAHCVLLRSISNSASARFSLRMNFAVVAKEASASSSVGWDVKNKRWIFFATISAVDRCVVGDLHRDSTLKPSRYWSSSERMRMSSSAPCFRGVDGGTGTEAGAGRWPALLSALRCGRTKRDECCMTAKPCRRLCTVKTKNAMQSTDSVRIKQSGRVK